MARAPKRLNSDGVAGALTQLISPRVIATSTKRLGITDDAARQRHYDALHSALVFYRSEIEQQPAVYVREEIHAVAVALEGLIAATRPAKEGKRGGISATTRAKIASAMRPYSGGISRLSFGDLIGAVSQAHIDLTAIDEIACEKRAGTKGPGAYTSRARALADLGVMLLRIYEHHHSSRSFILGERQERLDAKGNEAGPTFNSPAFRWFKPIIRAMVPDIKDSEVFHAAKAARATATAQDAAARLRCAFWLALVCIASGGSAPSVPAEADAQATIDTLAQWFR